MNSQPPGAGNGGNIAIRLGEDIALCTPTLICKGFMTPADMCLVDLDGKQLAGTRKRTSEAMTHFGIMKRQPAAKACVHAHPPHATAFAIASRWAGSIVSCFAPTDRIGTVSFGRSATRSHFSSFPLAPSSLGPCIGM